MDDSRVTIAAVAVIVGMLGLGAASLWVAISVAAADGTGWLLLVCQVVLAVIGWSFSVLGLA
jgi:hypothetical protein